MMTHTALYDETYCTVWWDMWHYRHAAARHHTSCSLSTDATFQKSGISLSNKFCSSCIKRKINLLLL